MTVTLAAKTVAITHFSPPPVAAEEHLLRDALAREMRTPTGRLALVLHLSRLPPPGPRPHHHQVARALMVASAQRHDGQVFRLRSGDLVLLARSQGEPGAATTADSSAPHALKQVLLRMLHSEAGVPDSEAATRHELVSILAVVAGHADLLALLQSSLAGTPAPPATAGDAGRRPEPPATLPAGRHLGPVANLLQVQTAAEIPVQNGAGALGRLGAVHRRVALSPGLLAARLAARGGLPTDPYLRQHLLDSLDPAVLAVVREAWSGGGPLDGAPREGVPPLHLALSIPCILSAGFADLAAICRAAAGRLGVEVSLMAACADPTGFARARAVLAASGMTMVLDGIDHLALTLTRPAALAADLVKLSWSPVLAQLPEARHRAVEAALAAVGRERVILAGADTEAAVHWGRAQGLHLFQGHHVEAMLAAARLSGCPTAAPCNLRQCVQRASAAAAAGRRGCASPALLDGFRPGIAGQTQAAA